MAITLLQAPAKFSPVYNPLIFLFSSTNTAQTGFKYVFDIYDGAGTTLILRIKQSARPTDGYGLINVHRVLESYVNNAGYDLTLPSAGVTQNTNSYKSYLLKVGEEYGSTPVVYPNLYTGTKKYAFNACLEYLDFASYNQDDFTITDGVSNARFLTNAPLSNDTNAKKVRLTESEWLYTQTDTIDAINTINFDAYNSSLALIKSCTIANPYNELLNDNSRFLRISTGPANLNLISSGSITGASQPLVTSDTYLYIISTTGLTGTSSQVVRYYVDSRCNNHDLYRLHFLNQLGGFDSFTFSKASEESYSEIIRSSYKKIAGSVSGSTWSASASDRSEVVYNTSAKRKLQLNSDWITEAESEWLKELILSPVVFIESGTDLIPVNMQESNYVLRQKITKPLFNLELNLSYTYEINSQRG